MPRTPAQPSSITSYPANYTKHTTAAMAYHIPVALSPIQPNRIPVALSPIQPSRIPVAMPATKPLKPFVVLKQLGEGSFGKVLKIQRHSDKKVSATSAFLRRLSRLVSADPRHEEGQDQQRAQARTCRPRGRMVRRSCFRIKHSPLTRILLSAASIVLSIIHTSSPPSRTGTTTRRSTCISTWM